MKKLTKKDILELEKLVESLGSANKLLEKWLMKEKLSLIKLLPAKEELIQSVFKRCVYVLICMKKQKKIIKQIISMPEFLQESSWMTLIDKLNSLKPRNQSTLVMMLFQMLVQDLILKGKVLKPFWTNVYEEKSEKLLLPIKTDSVDSVSNSLNDWSQNQVERLSLLKIVKKKHQNKSLQKTFSPSFISSLAEKWEKENIQPIKLKTLKVKIYPTYKQKQILNEYINTSRYVYNKCIYEIEVNKEKINTYDLRDKLVTYKTKKEYGFYKEFEIKIDKIKEQKKKEKNKTIIEEYNDQIKQLQNELREETKKVKYTINNNITDFEMKTPKNIRFNAIKRCTDAYKTSFANLKNGNIKYFKMKYKKKTEPKHSFTIDKCDISIKNNSFRIYPTILKENSLFKVSKRVSKKMKNIDIQGQVDIIRFNNEYTLNIPIKTIEFSNEKTNNIASVDPGLRTFATVHQSNISNGETAIIEYEHKRSLIKKLNIKIDKMKNAKQIYKINLSDIKKRIKKKAYVKIERKKDNIINETHWSFINHLLKENDVIYFGDIKSHGIVKNGINKNVNRETNDLKFYLLKQRLLYKSSLYKSKTVIMVNECYTSKTCSSCGTINENIGSSKTFNCGNKKCNLKADRDVNACKNIKLKGLLS
jgi:putative transposase